MDISHSDVNTDSSVKQEPNSSLPNGNIYSADTDSIGTESYNYSVRNSDEMRSSPLFSSPLSVDDDVDVAETNNLVQNVIEMLSADALCDLGQAGNEETIVDRATGTGMTWDLNEAVTWDLDSIDVDSLLQDVPEFTISIGSVQRAAAPCCHCGNYHNVSCTSHCHCCQLGWCL